MEEEEKHKKKCLAVLFFDLVLCILLMIPFFTAKEPKGENEIKEQEAPLAGPLLEVFAEETEDEEEIELEADDEYVFSGEIVDDGYELSKSYDYYDFADEDIDFSYKSNDSNSFTTGTKTTPTATTVKKLTTNTASTSSPQSSYIAANIDEEETPKTVNTKANTYSKVVTNNTLSESNTNNEEKKTTSDTTDKTSKDTNKETENKTGSSSNSGTTNNNNGTTSGSSTGNSSGTNTGSSTGNNSETNTGSQTDTTKPEPSTTDDIRIEEAKKKKEINVDFLQQSGTMLVEYKDSETDTANSIRRYAYGYISPSRTASYNIDSYYKMTNLCGTDKIETVTKTVTPTQEGRSFKFVLPKAGWYALMVVDDELGSQFYEVYVDDTNVIIHEDEDIDMPRLQIEGKKITGIKDNAEGNICYIKASDTKEYTKGNTVRSYIGGNLNVWTIDDKGLVYKLKVVLNTINADTEKLEKLMMQCEQNMTNYFKVTKEEFDKVTAPGFYAVATNVDEVQRLLTKGYILLGNVEGTQTDVDLLVLQLTDAYKALQKNEKEIKPGFSTVEGKAIIVNIPPMYDLEYIVYNIKSSIDDKPLAIVQKDWTGIAANKYKKVTSIPNGQYVLENLEDGIYTLMIKVKRTEQGVTNSYIYFEYPVVSVNDSDIYFALRRLYSDDDSAIKNAEKTLSSVKKKSLQTGELGEQFVSDTLYNSLSNEIKNAKSLALAVEEKLANKSETGEDLKKIIDTIGNLNAADRKVNQGIEKVRIEQTLTITCEDKEKGEFLVRNPESGLTKVYVAKGTHTTWNSFSKGGYQDIKIETHDEIKMAAFKVDGNGFYTVYCKFSDSTYKFISIKEEGFGGTYEEEVKEQPKDTTPFVNTGACTEAGMSVILDSNKNSISWIAFGEGKYESWKDMLLKNEKGIHYIAQNETVLIPTWTDSNVIYTFFFKGLSGNSDYIVYISGTNSKKFSTIDESFYESD